MLLNGSILLQVCLLITLTQCQDYEGSYDIDESDHSDVQDDSGPVDYSKYYSVDTSAPLVSAQGNPSDISFTTPIEHAAFFAPTIEFGASVKQAVVQPKNPFAAQTESLGFVSNSEQFPAFFSNSKFPVDYFEAAQKSQNQENAENNDFVGSGPNYISYNLPATLDGEYSTGVEKVEKPIKQRKNKKVHQYDVEKDASSEYEYQPSAPSRKYADYNVGKSSSTVSQHPQAPGYYEKLTQAPKATLYQKYSFRPVGEEGAQSKFLGSLISTVAPFNPSYSKIASTSAPAIEGQSSENVPSHLKDKNCRRVKKHISNEDGHDRRKREAMNCFVCEDPENNSKYTQCSYATEPEPTNDYSRISERFSSKPKQEGDGFRYKRYSGDDNLDPYEYIKARSQKQYSEAEETKDYGEYKIPDYYTSDSGIDRSFSEVQSEAIAKNPANCHKEESNGMTCTICKDPKTGGNFEQCSYTSEPKEQKYAYVTEKKYDSDEPEEGSESKPSVQTKQVESSIKPSERSDAVIEPSEEYKSLTAASNDKYSKLEDFKPSEEYKANYEGHDKFKLSDEYNPDSKEDPTSKKEEYKPEGYHRGMQGKSSAPKKLIDDDPYDIPKHFAESTIKEQKKGIRGLEPSLYGSSDSSEVEGGDADSSSDVEAYKDIDEYHFKLFPEFNNEESQQAETVANNPSADSTRKDVEEVLAEFSKKDRSACKKAEKNGMTCYLCVDKNGIQHEECMYVSESKPQASHLAYHEVKQIKSPNNENKEAEQAPAATEIKRTYIKKVTTPTPVEMQAAASEEFESKIKYNPNKSRRKNVKKVKEPEHSATNEDPERLTEDENEPKLKAPLEFVADGEEGAFSAETKPVYSKVLGVKLPKYMLEKSEFEKEFDEFAGLSE